MKCSRWSRGQRARAVAALTNGQLLSAWSGVRAWTFPITLFSLSPRNDATTGIGSHRLFGGAEWIRGDGGAKRFAVTRWRSEVNSNCRYRFLSVRRQRRVIICDAETSCPHGSELHSGLALLSLCSREAFSSCGMSNTATDSAAEGNPLWHRSLQRQTYSASQKCGPGWGALHNSSRCRKA